MITLNQNTMKLEVVSNKILNTQLNPKFHSLNNKLFKLHAAVIRESKQFYTVTPVKVNVFVWNATWRVCTKIMTLRASKNLLLISEIQELKLFAKD